jgi:hypothetical protein
LHTLGNAAIFHHLIFIIRDQSIDLAMLAVDAATMPDNVTILRPSIIERMLSRPAAFNALDETLLHQHTPSMHHMCPKQCPQEGYRHEEWSHRSIWETYI